MEGGPRRGARSGGVFREGEDGGSGGRVDGCAVTEQGRLAVVPGRLQDSGLCELQQLSQVLVLVLQLRDVLHRLLRGSVILLHGERDDCRHVVQLVGAVEQLLRGREGEGREGREGERGGRGGRGRGEGGEGGGEGERE